MLGTFKTRPEILLHPNIPKPLHGIAPRVVKGQAWWDVVRRQAYASTGFRCAACGVRKQDAKYHQWLEAHELYEYDYEAGRLTLKEIVPLCHSCHNYIHSGRMAMMLDSGEMTEEMYLDILAHGDRLIKGLKRPEAPLTCAEWPDWRMVIDGKRYGPSTPNMSAWLRGEWKNWKP